jgi:hypothetical protein
MSWSSLSILLPDSLFQRFLALLCSSEVRTVRAEPDETTSHSTKPASGQVAGYVEAFTNS